MALQNRVTPFGELVTVPERGLVMGNRGILHDATRRIRRRWGHRHWIVCLCDFKGRRRAIMAPGRWTELFFLDEATALAAGHRPCFECRRPAAKSFQAAWQRGNGGALPRAPVMDAMLHAERLDGRARRLHPLDRDVASLPDGAMLAAGEDSFLVHGGTLRRWSHGGYSAVPSVPDALRLLTPPSTVRTLRAGYVPILHPTA